MLKQLILRKTNIFLDKINTYTIEREYIFIGTIM